MVETTAIYTIVKIMETLPEAAQHQLVDHVRDYLADMDDEAEWDNLFEETQEQLRASARKARQEIAEGKAEPMDFDRL